MLDTGSALRSVYAFKIARKDGILSFFRVYLQSYFITGRQIREHLEYDQELNNQLYRLLSLALAGEYNCAIRERSYLDSKELIIYTSSYASTTFDYELSEIKGEKALITPSNYLLAKKLVKLINNKEKEKKKPKIDLL